MIYHLFIYLLFVHNRQLKAGKIKLYYSEVVKTKQSQVKRKMQMKNIKNDNNENKCNLNKMEESSFHAHQNVYRTGTLLQKYSQISISKSVNRCFLNIKFDFSLFSLEMVLQRLSKDDPTKKQIDTEIKVRLKCAPAR